jgi:hypothetical protein
MTRPGRAIPRPTPAKRWVMTLALLAFFFQNLAIQSHFHPLAQPQNVKTATAAHLPATTPLRNQEPVDQCRLCQELMHAGVFVTPSVSAILATLTFATAVFTAWPSAALSLVTAFAWQSRAPPRR